MPHITKTEQRPKFRNYQLKDGSKITRDTNNKPYFISSEAFTELSNRINEKKLQRAKSCSKLFDAIFKSKKKKESNPWSLDF